MRRRDLIGAMAMCGFLAACGGDPGTPPYRYKLKVEVETPEGVRSGESVIQVQWWQGSKEAFGTQASAGFKVEGEGVAIDMPHGQTLFVLLSSPSNPDWAAWAFAGIAADVKNPHDVGFRRYDVPKTLKRSNEVVSNLPYFVRFRDLQDSRTIQEVNPDDLLPTFGAGYRIKSVTVQKTDEEISESLKRRLPWLSKPGVLVEHRRGTPIGDVPRVTLLNTFDFVRGDSE